MSANQEMRVPTRAMPVPPTLSLCVQNQPCSTGSSESAEGVGEHLLIGCIGVQPYLFEEVCGVVCEVPSAENLSCEYETSNLRASELSTLEAISVMCANC